MTEWFGSRFFVIPNLFRDLCFWFKIRVLKPRPVGKVLYLTIGAWYSYELLVAGIEYGIKG